jgi:hypothetical protein
MQEESLGIVWREGNFARSKDIVKRTEHWRDALYVKNLRLKNQNFGNG